MSRCVVAHLQRCSPKAVHRAGVAVLARHQPLHRVELALCRRKVPARAACIPAAQPRSTGCQDVVLSSPCAAAEHPQAGHAAPHVVLPHTCKVHAQQRRRGLTAVCACRSHRCSHLTPAHSERPVNFPGKPLANGVPQGLYVYMLSTPQCQEQQQQAHINVVARAEVAHPGDIPHRGEEQQLYDVPAGLLCQEQLCHDPSTARRCLAADALSCSYSSKQCITCGQSSPQQQQSHDGPRTHGPAGARAWDPDGHSKIKSRTKCAWCRQTSTVPCGTDLSRVLS